MTGREVVGLIALLGFVALLIFGSSNHPSPSESPKQDAQLAVAQAQVDNDPTEWVTHAKSQQEKAALVSMAALIRTHGYDCPTLARLWPRAMETPYGYRLEALCGPGGVNGGAYPNLHYAVYPQSQSVRVCAPFGAFSAECE